MRTLKDREKDKEMVRVNSPSKILTYFSDLYHEFADDEIEAGNLAFAKLVRQIADDLAMIAYHARKR